MKVEKEPGRKAELCEEIAELARIHLQDPRDDGIVEIDGQIASAVAESRWDDVSKWHRVRLRLLRYRQQSYVAARLLSPSDSRRLS